CSPGFARKDLEQYGHIVARLAEKAETAGRRVDTVQRLDAGHDAVDPAITLFVQVGRAPAEPVVDDRPADRALGGEQAVVTATRTHIAVVLAQARIARVEIHSAARGVLAIQGALRAAQNLDALDVIRLQRLNRADRLVDLVEVHRDGAALVLAPVLG